MYIFSGLKDMLLCRIGFVLIGDYILVYLKKVWKRLEKFWMFLLDYYCFFDYDEFKNVFYKWFEMIEDGFWKKFWILKFDGSEMFL